MTAPDPRLDEIQARLDAVTEWRRHFQAPQSLIDYSQRDVPYLLAEIRKARDALGRVEEIADLYRFTIMSRDIRAAVAAAKGSQ